MRSTNLLAIYIFALWVTTFTTHAQIPGQKQLDEDSLFIVSNYSKFEYQIPMRDGVKLFTAVYIPKDNSQKYPMMLTRTPYSVSPYGADKYKTRIGPSMAFAREKFIFVYQDVRGRFMSEGIFENVRPFITDKKNKKAIDESTDTYDTIDWLLKNITSNNGKVGQWGISYPGFYSSAGALSGHPALVAVSPQAPIADWFWDDFFHHGAFFLPHGFNFFSAFGRARPTPTTEWKRGFKYPTPDGYNFHLREMKTLKALHEKIFLDSIPFWNELVKHPNYDSFWQERNILPRLKNIRPAMLVVGGWFDAEDLYGVLKTYSSIEANNPGISNSIVMGPWRHGGWARDDGSRLGHVFFGDSILSSVFYQENIELPFFVHHLKGTGTGKLPEAYMFETGSNRWRQFNSWPPKNLEKKKLYLQAAEKLSFNPPSESTNNYSEFISDPSKPVPYTESITTVMTKEYMTEDQRFASRRPDVLVYQTDILKEDITLAGNSFCNLKISTSGSDADWIVKIIDVYPDNHPNYSFTPSHIKMGGYQQMVRSEVFRGRFRNSYEKPEPFTPHQLTDVKFELQDVLHTFKKGHRIMVQIQSTWFPLVDRNPQKYVDNIFNADEKDFIKATHRVYHAKDNASFIEVGVLND